MSGVRKKDQTPHRLTVLDKCLDLYDHTTTLTANEKVFDRTYKSLIDRIDYEASMIYHCCRAANEDNDNRVKDEAEIRIDLQQEALKHCAWLKTCIRLAQRKFHLRAKKVVFWNDLVKDAAEYIKNWNVSEIRNYKEKFGL